MGLLILLFTVTQFLYVGSNSVILYLHTTSRQKQIEYRRPTEYENLTILIPLYRERKEVITETILQIKRSTYPLDMIDVHLVYEEDDEIVTQYVDSLIDEEYITGLEVKKESPIWDIIGENFSDVTVYSEFPRNKARSLAYAMQIIQPKDGIITVLDSDTGFDPTLFEHGLVGLQDGYDIVQAKQTVRNTEDGLLPYLESAGISTWANTIYSHTTDVPYQLLGKAYFLTVDTFNDTVGWNPYSTTEDLTLGLELYRKGAKLGILDTYISDLCPSSYKSWVTQKRRWTRGPYEHINDVEWASPWQRLQFASSALLPQAITINNAIGLPVGFTVGYLAFTGSITVPFAALILTGINGIFWLWYGLKTYQSSLKANTFKKPLHKLAYIIINNPVGQSIYAALWAYPVLLTLYDVLMKHESTFIVTEK